MNRSRRIVLLFAVIGLVAVTGRGMSLRAQPTEGTVVARFRDAEAVASDPKGRIYVADAGRDVISIFEPSEGETLHEGAIGGPGTRVGEFDRPADVDPTNGLTVLVADAGNGRLQRFSEEGQFLEAIPVGPSLRSGAEQRFFEDGRDGSEIQGDGRPVAVASTSSNEIFVIDERDGVVVKFDAQRRFAGEIGTSYGRRGALQTPVALATGRNRELYVADRAAEAVFVYDFFGTFLRRLQTPKVPSVSALEWVRDRLWIVCSDRIVVWNPAAGATQTRMVTLDEPLVDAVRENSVVYLLTPTRLLRREGW